MYFIYVLTYNMGNEPPEIAVMGVVQDVLDIVESSLVIKEEAVAIGSPIRRCPSMKKQKHTLGIQEK